MTLRGIIWASVSTAAQADDDKTSIPSQISEAQRWAADNDIKIMDTMIVPGHSRRYTRIEECNRDMLKAGIDAFDKLINHWRAKDFDVLIVRDGNRFARTQSLHAMVVEDTISIGARIFSMSDGWVDESNYRLFIAMNGYMAASYIDHLVKGQKKTKQANAARGIPPGSRLIYSHKALRNEYGKIQSFVVDESKRRLFDDLKTLLLEGVGWKHIEADIYERFGHARPDGKPFTRFFFYHLLHNPWFWGHAARHYKDVGLANGQKTDLWVFDSDMPAPEGVQIWRNTHEATYTGVDAEEVKAELRRRRMVIRGTARPLRTHSFSGLLICEYCGFRLAFRRDASRWESHKYACKSKETARDPSKACTKRRVITERKVKTWVHELLKIARAGKGDFLFSETGIDAAARAGELKVEIGEIENQIRRLIAKQSRASDDLAGLYDEQIEALGAQIKILRENLTRTERDIDRDELQARVQVLKEIQSFDELEFWELPETKINQLLHRFFGRWRIRVKDQEIVGLKRV